MTDFDFTQEHAGLDDTHKARRYFEKFDAITGHLSRVAAVMEREGRLTKLEARVLGAMVLMIAGTFRALSLKYLMTGRADRSLGVLDIDRVESGFPTFREVLTISNDAAQVDRHLGGMMSVSELKSEMVRQIVGDLQIPTRLQFAMSQRLYYEELMQGHLFWAQNDPALVWLEGVAPPPAPLRHKPLPRGPGRLRFPHPGAIEGSP